MKRVNGSREVYARPSSRKTGRTPRVKRNGPGEKGTSKRGPKRDLKDDPETQGGGKDELVGEIQGTDASQQSAIHAAAGLYLTLFKRLFASFRQEACRCLGGKAGKVMARAEERFGLGDSAFDLTLSDPESVVSILAFIEAVTREAPIFKRARLRQQALMLVSELYNTHYGILEQFQAHDMLEQFYCRLVNRR